MMPLTKDRNKGKHKQTNSREHRKNTNISQVYDVKLSSNKCQMTLLSQVELSLKRHKTYDTKQKRNKPETITIN